MTMQVTIKETTDETGSKFITPDIRKAMRERDRLKLRRNQLPNPEILKTGE